MNFPPLRLGVPVTWALVTLVTLAALVTSAGKAAAAGESGLQLPNAPGRELVAARCVACHSVDYLLMHDGVLDRKGWEASIAKMRKAMGAPMSDEDAGVILDYLVGQYGKHTDMP